MKNVIKFFGCTLLAATMGLSSCVENEVATEVAQIRQAQLDKLNAEVSLALANVDKQTIENAYDVANNAFMLQQTEAQLVQSMAMIDANTQRYMAEQQEYELEYAENLAEYERFINQGQFDANVSDLLSLFTNASGQLRKFYNDRIHDQKNLATAQLMLAASSSFTFDQLKDQYDIQLVGKQAELVANKAAAEIFIASLADSTIIFDQLIDLRTTIENLNEQKDSLTAAAAIAKAANDAVAAMITAHNAGIVIFEGLVADTVTKVASIATETDKITDANIALVPLNTDLTLKKATLTAKTNELSAATSAYNTKLALYNTANTNNTNAVNDLNAKENLLVIAQNNYNAGASAVPPLSAAELQILQDKLDAAQLARDDAFNVVNDADGTAAKLAQANSDKNAAKTTMDTAQGAVNTAQSAVDTAQGLVDAQLDIITESTGKIAGYESDLKALTAQIAALQERYDAGLLEVEPLLIEEKTTKAALQLVTLAQAENTAMLTGLTAAATALEGSLESIRDTLADVETHILALEKEVADLAKMIANNVIDKAYAEGEVVRLQAILDTTEARITELEAIVAHYQTLLEEAIAAQG